MARRRRRMALGPGAAIWYDAAVLTRVLVVSVALSGMAHADHTKEDARRLSAKLDAILRHADGKPAAKKHAAVAAAPIARADQEPAQPQPQPRAHDDEGDALGRVLAHSFRIAFDPDELALHTRAIPKTPADLAAHLDRAIPKTPEQWAEHIQRAVPKSPEELAEHLRRLPKTPAEVNAHLSRLDRALAAQHHK
jgi:hypothetical protein